MKKYTTRVGVVLFLAVFSQGAFAAPKVGPSPAGSTRILLGSALDGTFVGSTSNPGLTMVMLMGEKSALQFYLGIPGIQPFQVGGGFAYKYALAGDNRKGFHIGIGLGLGGMAFPTLALARSFYVNVSPITGVHFEVAEKVLVSFDAGLAFKIVTEGTSNLELVLGGNSPLLGASIVFEI